MAGLVVPLVADYIDQSSMGLASTYQNIAFNMATILILSIVPEIAAHIDVGYLFYTVAILSIITAFILIFAIRDVTVQEEVEQIEVS